MKCNYKIENKIKFYAIYNSFKVNNVNKNKYNKT